MILEILLVYSVNGAPNQISNRVFESFEECAWFVNEVARDTVVNSDYAFRFLAQDGILFEGQCIDKKDYYKEI